MDKLMIACTSVLALVLLVLALLSSLGLVSVYHTHANGGIAIGDCYHFDVGVEVYGTPGFFVNEC